MSMAVVNNTRAAGVASDPAAADVHGCFPPVVDSAAATVSDS
jgi:hypothetical protein